ncbi:mate-domain-containing protein [Jimgerdemannia flammicorona]|uniref:Mate-domain-containing protein n=1 Tax=Jimgerdemannia flammicorona TaxID=994334 RepID=A0A433QJ12_9FUNG|nr:mate-domain-containing protein [Jimgerdemannia flammicorona]
MSTYDREPLDPWRDSNNFPELQGPAVEAALANETLIDERTSLLGNRAYLDDDDDDDTYGDESGDHQERRRGIEIHASGKFWRDMRIVGPQEAKILVKYSGPLIITYMLQIGLRIVDIWFIELAAASLGGMFCMITGFALGWGMTTGKFPLSTCSSPSSHQTHNISLPPSSHGYALFAGTHGCDESANGGPDSAARRPYPGMPVCAYLHHLVQRREHPYFPRADSGACRDGSAVYLDYLASVAAYPGHCVPEEIFAIARCVPLFVVIMGYPRYRFAPHSPPSALSHRPHACHNPHSLHRLPLQHPFQHLLPPLPQSGLYRRATCHFHHLLLHHYRHDPLHPLRDRLPQVLGGLVTRRPQGVGGVLEACVSTDWAFEVCAIAAGVLGKTSLAAQSIAVSSNTFLIMIPLYVHTPRVLVFLSPTTRSLYNVFNFPFSQMSIPSSAIAISTAVRTGHNLGALRPNAARVTAWWSVVIAVFVCVTNSSLLIALRYRYARWFTDDTDVIGVVIELVPVVAATQFCMGIGAILSGVLNGSGRQRTVALLNISSYFLLGLPLGLFLCFRCDMGLVGIWWGVFAAGVIKISGEMLVVGYTNWVGEAERAVKRVREGRRVGGRQY